MLNNLRIKAKLLVSFGLVIVLSIVLAVFAVVALNENSDNYRNKLDYSQQRLQVAMNLRYNVMDLRRITTAIRADSGNETRQQEHSTSVGNIVAQINTQLDRYVELVRTDYATAQQQKDMLAQEAESVRSIVAQYRRDLIDPNIAFGMVGDLESLSANSTAQAGLIASLNEALNNMVAVEQALAETLIESTNASAGTYRRLLIIIATVIAVASVFLAIYIANSISKPLHEYDTWMQVTSKGNIVWTPEELVVLEKLRVRRDEIGTLVNSYAELIDYMAQICDDLSMVASGNLDFEVVPSSDKDMLAVALKKMLDDLNNMFSEITMTGHQVSLGSKQIADGAQNLAQGSTEQAATVQQLSASISEVAEKTKGNADMAVRAASLAKTIMENAKKGSTQMDEMTDAVKEINQASQSISKVIKVIDDIAFQTNILALNAAVEAARAGQHGKGFAVVAEEVRNLAAKSAEAAKDTGGLISNSMEKAELGARIAGETATSLAAIVSGINESTQLVNDIAKSSEEQSFSIEQINNGIDQVAQVVQQNSATAEQSAAASVEMSRQSNALEQLIGQFKLKESSSAAQKLLPSKYID